MNAYEIGSHFLRWALNDESRAAALDPAHRSDLDWLRVAPFALLHVLCLAAIWTGISSTAFFVAVGLYVLRMFAITAFYHRYFSHRAYRVGRVTQFLMAVLGCTAGQRGPIWWAGHHRQHHARSDEVDDPHSPRISGFWYSHVVWFLTKGTFATPIERVRDWRRFPELVWLERFEWVPFVLLGTSCWMLGAWMQTNVPDAGTSGAQMFIVGFVWSTVAAYHATYLTNSVAHRYGKRPFATSDDSRNNALVAFLTMGEGWHNNHHYYPASARQGFVWWEVDPSYWILKCLAALGIVHHLKPVPDFVMDARGKERAQ